MFENIKAPTDWFYSKKFNYWQKTNKKIVVYVSELIFGYQVQLYYRGKIGFCELEARTDGKGQTSYSKMFQLGEEWLEQYAEGNPKMIQQDIYHISNPNGVWVNNREEKKYWI